MNKLAISIYAILVLAVVASADNSHVQCVPEPTTLLALVPGLGLLLRRIKKA